MCGVVTHLKTCAARCARCFQCGHLISRRNGGEDIEENLVCLCARCNGSIGGENVGDYIRRELGRRGSHSDGVIGLAAGKVPTYSDRNEPMRSGLMFRDVSGDK